MATLSGALALALAATAQHEHGGEPGELGKV
jgi:hypothetical protein